MASGVRFDVTAVDRASGPIDRLRAKFNELGAGGAGRSILTGVGLGIGAAGFNLLTTAASGAVDMIGNAVRGAIQEEAGIKRLDASLKANVQGWDGNRDAIERVLKARMNLGFSDDEQRDSLAKLVAATHDVNKALDIQRTAMDLARLKGISLGDASSALAKALGGQAKSLKELIPELKAGSSATEILAAVQKLAAGQADTFAASIDGKATRAMTKFNDALENLAAKALPLIADGLDRVNDGVTVFSSAVDGDFSPAMKSANDGLQEFNKHANDLGRLAVPGLALVEDWINKDALAVEALNRATDEQALAGYRAQAAIGAQQRAYEDAQVALTDWDRQLSADDASVKRLIRTMPALGEKVHEVAKHVQIDGYGAAFSFQKGFDDARDTTKTAVDHFLHALTHPVDLNKEKMKLLGFLNGKQLAAGLNSANPYVRSAAEDAQKAAVEELTSLGYKFVAVGTYLGHEVAKGFKKGTAGHFNVTPTGGGHIPGTERAAGGPRSAAGNWVGERGTAEWVGPSSVLPDQGSGGFASGGGSVTVNMNISGPASFSPGYWEEFARAAGPSIARYLNQRGFIARTA